MTQTSVVNLIQQGQNYLANGHPQQALIIGQQALEINPVFADAHLIVAIAAQQLRKHNTAMHAINNVIELDIKNEMAHIIRANISSQIHSPAETVKLCQSSLKVFPNNPQLWLDLSQHEYKNYNNAAADLAFKKHLVLSATSPLLGIALEHFFKQDFFASEKSVRQHLSRHPNDVSALRLLGEIALNLGIFEDAQRLFEKVLSIAPKYNLARLNYAHVLNKREQNQAAMTQVQLLEQQQPNHPPILTIKAAVLVKLGRYQDAISLYKQLLSAQPNQPEIWASLGHTYKTTGDKQESINAYLSALKYNPDYGDAYWSLANLKTYKFSDEQVKQMQLSYNKLSTNENENLAQICFALAKALETNQQIDKAFYYYQLGNQIKSKLEPYDKDELEQLIKRNKDHFNAANIASILPPNNKTQQDITPIFIVGLPRSGSTLLEQILASHSEIDGTKELPDVIALARRLGNRKKKQDEDQYPYSLAKLSEHEKIALGQQYIESSAHLRGSAPYFIDKMPNNFLHIGLIKTILPNAKIIDARRNPVASGFSCFKQLFANGQNFSYNLKDIQHYYHHYLELMQFWRSCFSHDIITIQYEDIVNDTEHQVRNILSFLELEFEDNCLEFHKNQRAVATASAEQVRQPINQKGLNAWQPFKHHLSDLLSI